MVANLVAGYKHGRVLYVVVGVSVAQQKWRYLRDKVKTVRDANGPGDEAIEGSRKMCVARAGTCIGEQRDVLIRRVSGEIEREKGGEGGAKTMAAERKTAQRARQ